MEAVAIRPSALSPHVGLPCQPSRDVSSIAELPVRTGGTLVREDRPLIVFNHPRVGKRATCVERPIGFGVAQRLNETQRSAPIRLDVQEMTYCVESW